MTLRTCKNCGESDVESLLSAPDFDSESLYVARRFLLARCSACGIISSVDVTLADIDQAYHMEYYRSNQAKFSWLIESIIDGFAKRRAHRIIRQWRTERTRPEDRRADPHVLDIGAGRGTHLKAFIAAGAVAEGIERSDFPLDPDLPLTREPLDSAYFAGRRFDIILIWHVLEHLDAIDKQLESIVDHLAPGGLLVIAVPNYGSQQRRWFNEYWFHLDQPRHVVHLEPDWLSARLVQRGLKIQQVDYLDWLQNCYGFIQSALNIFFPSQFNRLYRLLKFGENLWVGNRILAILPWSVPTVLLLPLATIECLWNSWRQAGATLTMSARLTDD